MTRLNESLYKFIFLNEVEFYFVKKEKNTDRFNLNHAVLEFHAENSNVCYDRDS